VAPVGHVFSAYPGALIMGRSNYLGVAGECQNFPPYPSFFGLLRYKSKNSLGRVPDGTSNTLLFGEYAGGFIPWGGSGGIPDGWSTGSWSCGFNYSCFGIDGNITIQDGNHGWWSYGSFHANRMVNFTYADGSVRQVSPEVDFNVWDALSGFNDGVVTTDDQVD